MARDYGRAPRGQRLGDHVPRNDGDVVTIIGALTVNGRTALMTHRGGTTKEVFRAYTEQVHAPELRQGDVVIFDNLAAHKYTEVRAITEGKGGKVMFLPPYSPDLNPIGLAWAWNKWWLKTCRARTEDSINTALYLAKELFTSEMAVHPDALDRHEATVRGLGVEAEDALRRARGGQNAPPRRNAKDPAHTPAESSPREPTAKSSNRSPSTSPRPATKASL